MSRYFILVLGSVWASVGALDCEELATYSPRSYTGGELVVNINTIFKCKPFPQGSWCGIAPGVYGPGTGSAWKNAWDEICPCGGDSSHEETRTHGLVEKSGLRKPKTDSISKSATKKTEAISNPLKMCPMGLFGGGSVDCRTSPDCCASGHCYEKNQFWGACRDSCVEGETNPYYPGEWSCNRLSSREQDVDGYASPNMDTSGLRKPNTVSAATDSATKMTNIMCPSVLLDGTVDCRASPDCCASGQCYEMNKWWASCKETCVGGRDDWSCNLLSSLGHGQVAAATLIASSTSPPAAGPPTKAQTGGVFLQAVGVCSGNGVDLTKYAFEDYYPPSQYSPLDTIDTPQFVALSFDDNGNSGLDGSFGGMSWLRSMLASKRHTDGSPVLASFYHTSKYANGQGDENPVYVKKSWRQALDDGHEIGIHSDQHPHGRGYSMAQWSAELETCIGWLTKPFDPNESESFPDYSAGVGAARSLIVGSRTPYLEYSNGMMQALVDHGIWYDSSIQDGWEAGQDGTNYIWPYTLDQGRSAFFSNPSLLPQPGLWELPMYPIIVPPDHVIRQYGIYYSLRNKCKRSADWFDTSSGKITGFDYNMWITFRMSSDEFLATLKYNLDLRLRGNRTPFMPGFHSDYYSDKFAAPNSSPSERRQALADFVDYALTKPEVHLTPMRDVLDWMRDPIPKECLGANNSG